jgi:hypothetical protein
MLRATYEAAARDTLLSAAGIHFLDAEPQSVVLERIERAAGEIDPRDPILEVIGQAGGLSSIVDGNDVPAFCRVAAVFRRALLESRDPTTNSLDLV